MWASVDRRGTDAARADREMIAFLGCRRSAPGRDYTESRVGDLVLHLVTS